MRVLARRGAHAIGTARSIEKGREACARIQGTATPVVLELGDFDSVVACTQEIAKLDLPIDMLICNAGIVLCKHEQLHGLATRISRASPSAPTAILANSCGSFAPGSRP